MRRITSIVRLFTLMICAAGSGTVFAQATTATGTTAAETPALQEVVVTGSRIPVPANISATSPIAVVTSQDINLMGATDSINIINTLPQNIISGGVDFGNQSNPLTATGGVSTVDLRGLGPQRTLVLMNGRRLGVGDPSTTNPNPAPDIDQIPTPLIERVDVVTGGASATYGSDAIAGVVNFILKKNFQGVQVDGQYSFSQHDQHNNYIQSVISAPDPNTGWQGQPPPTGSISDGNIHDLSVILGTNFADGNGNITGYMVYHDQAPIAGNARDFSDCELVSNGQIASPVTNGYECLGSSNSNRFTPFATTLNGVAQSPLGVGHRYTVVGNQLLPWPQAGSNPPANFNFNNFEYLQREDKRYQGGFFAHEDLNDYVKPYTEFTFMQDTTTAIVAPSGLFVGGNPITADGNYLVNCSNPLLSAQQRGLICTPAQITADTANPGSASANLQIGRRNIEGGGRDSTYTHNNFRMVAGLTGNLVDDTWTYDAYGSYYYVNAFANNTNYLSYQLISNALQATTKNGQPVCISGGSCVPYNIFTQGGVTPAQLNYLYQPGTSSGNNTESIAHFDTTGELGKYGLTSPWARDGVAVNVGGEYRKESVTFAPDAAELQGYLAGFSGASVPTNASYDVSEAFVETRVPIAADKPWIYDLNADLGYRYSNYNPQGTTNTYKFEVQYAPIQDVRVRGSYDRAVRAPNLIELYNAPSIGQEQVQTTDPCAPIQTGKGLTPAVASLAECQHSGVTAAQYGNGGTVTGAQAYTGTITQCVAGQCSQVIQGNPYLKPEVATTWSVGFTVTPTALPGFNASIDYYHIHLSDGVSAIPLNVIVPGCLYQNISTYCQQIVRNTSGSITGSTVAGGGYLLQKDQNVGVSEVSGVDLIVNYHWHLPTGWGSMSAALNGAYVNKNTTTPYYGAVTYDCAGLFGSSCGQSSINPIWRHNLRVNWETPWNLLFSAQWRFIGPVSFDNNSTNSALANVEEGAYDAYQARIPGYSYFDLTAEWHPTTNLTARIGVNNVLDKDPPVVPEADITGNNGPANSYQAYDLLGRTIFFAVTGKF